MDRGVCLPADVRIQAPGEVRHPRRQERYVSQRRFHERVCLGHVVQPARRLCATERGDRQQRIRSHRPPLELQRGLEVEVPIFAFAL